MECRVKSCDKPVVIKKHQLCWAHYLKWWRYGDPERQQTYRCSGEDHPNYKHGRWNDPTYKTWVHMVSRCYNPKDEAYNRYGNQGITVCNRWRESFWNFLADMGEKPDRLTLDRIDSTRSYEPENCRWASYTEQGRNRPSFVKLSKGKADEIRNLPRRARNGRRSGYSRKEIAEIYGVSVATVKKILSRAYWK